MGILYKRYLGHLRLLRSSGGKENPGSGILHRSCRVVYANILCLYKNLSDLSLIFRGGDVVYCSETLVSSRRHISELMIPVFDRQMELHRREIDRFRRSPVCVRDGFSAYK